MVNSTKFRVYAAFLGVFLLGGLAGGGVVYATQRQTLASLASDDTGELRDRRRLFALGRQLGLSPTQREQVRHILMRTRPERRRLMRAAFQTCGEPLRAHKAKLDDEIRKLLDPEQQREFDELLRAQHERFPFGPRGE